MNTTYKSVRELLAPDTAEARRHDLFVSLIAKPVTEEDLYDCVRVIREQMITVDLGITETNSPIDTCGTGGSGMRTINTSTLVAFILAAGGVKVAKHGGRAASGNCGSANIMEKLGVNISLSVEQEQRLYHELGIVFLSAHMHHPGLAAIARLRSIYGKPTIFNLAAPLCNPAGLKKQMIGTTTYRKALLLNNMIKWLGGSESSMVVAASSGLDEVAILGQTHYLWRHKGHSLESVFNPEHFGLNCQCVDDFLCGPSDRYVYIFHTVLAGKQSKHLDLVLTNAAFGFYAAGAVEDLKAGYHMARRIVAQGSALRKFNEYLTLSRKK